MFKILVKKGEKINFASHFSKMLANDPTTSHSDNIRPYKPLWKLNSDNFMEDWSFLNGQLQNSK
jgi:hypothetical protein